MSYCRTARGTMQWDFRTPAIRTGANLLLYYRPGSDNRDVELLLELLDFHFDAALPFLRIRSESLVKARVIPTAGLQAHGVDRALEFDAHGHVGELRLGCFRRGQHGNGSDRAELADVFGLQKRVKVPSGCFRFRKFEIPASRVWIW